MKSAGRRYPKKPPVAASIRNTILDIPSQKMAVIFEREHRDRTVFQIREELMERVLDRCYEIYLEKQSVFFTGYCAYLAFKQLFQWAFFPRDPGEINYTDTTKWTPDKPPEPSPRDTWAGYSVPIIKKPKVEDKNVYVDEKDLKDPCETYNEQIKPASRSQPSDTKSTSGSTNIQPKELQLPDETIFPSQAHKKPHVTLKRLSSSISSNQRHIDASMFTKIKSMPYTSLPTAPPPYEHFEIPMQTPFDDQFIDPNVAPPRKLQQDTRSPFRVPITCKVLDESDPCLDPGLPKKLSKRLVHKEMKNIIKPGGTCSQPFQELEDQNDNKEKELDLSSSGGELVVDQDDAINKIKNHTFNDFE